MRRLLFLFGCAVLLLCAAAAPALAAGAGSRAAACLRRFRRPARIWS